jgi:uncharacterized YigZ family protein
VTNLQKQFKTVLNRASCEIEEKKSRFIATVRPIKTEEEALELISEMKSKYWDASHNVYAYFLNGDTVIQRFSDDGEPSGTAGIPVLEAIKRSGVQDVVVVVTRYFGGTLLGASGLIRTYAKSAAAGIEQAVIVYRRLCDEVGIIMEYTLLGKVQNIIANRQYTIKETIYEQDAEIRVYIPVDETEAFIAELTEATNARVLVDTGKKSYITVDLQGKLINTDS